MTDTNNIPPIQFKRSDIIGRVPTANDLAVGELALNFADKKIYTKDSDDNVVSLGLAAAAEGNALVVTDLTTTQYADITTYLATVPNKVNGQLVAADINGAFQTIVIKDAALNIGEQYRLLIEKDVLIHSTQYYTDNANSILKEYSREYVFTGSDFIGQPTSFDFVDEARMHSADTDIGLLEGDSATYTIAGPTGNGDRIIEHLWNSSSSRWQAPGETHFYTTGVNDTNLENFWPAADNVDCIAKVYNVDTNSWITYIAQTSSWFEQYLDNPPGLSFPSFSSETEVAGVPVGNALTIYEADDSLYYYETNTGNTFSQNNTRVSNTVATAKYWNVCSDGQGDVNVTFSATNAYSSSYDMLHAFDQTSQGWLSNSKTGYVQVNMQITSVTQGTYKPQGYTVRGRNVSTSTDYMSRIDWTFTFSDGHTYTAVTTAADRYRYHHAEIPLSEYGEPNSTIGVTNVLMVCTRGSSWGGLWGFQQIGHYRDMFPVNGLYLKSSNIGEPYQQITRLI